MADDNPAVLETLRTLKTMGIRIALDDSAPATRASAICGASRSTRSRSTGHSCKGRRTTRVSGDPGGDPGHVPQAWSRGLGEAWRRGNSYRCCGSADAPRCRVTCSGGDAGERVETFVKNNIRQLNQESGLVAAATEFELAT